MVLVAFWRIPRVMIRLLFYREYGALFDLFPSSDKWVNYQVKWDASFISISSFDWIASHNLLYLCLLSFFPLLLNHNHNGLIWKRLNVTFFEEDFFFQLLFTSCIQSNKRYFILIFCYGISFHHRIETCATR